jgi:hypothetical protein
MLMEKTRRRSKWIALAGTGALLVTMLAVLPGESSAANLASGQTAYVVNGEEETFTFDPITRKDGTLLPVEVFQRFGVQVEGALGRTVTLKKRDVSMELTLGRKAFLLNALPNSTAVEPIRLNGRLFLPAELLRHFGVEVSQDGSYVFLREFVTGQPTIKVTQQSEYDALKSARTFNRSVKLDSGQYAEGEFTLLNADLLQMDKLPVAWGARARLQGLQESGTLVLVKLKNYANKTGTFTTSGLYLIDENRNQYEVQEVIDLGQGLLSGKLAPGADRVGVLVFPKLKPNPGIVKLYYDGNPGDLGSWSNP